MSLCAGLRPAGGPSPPSYSKELKTKFATFNARSETAAEKATFRGSVKSKRAILPADFYYEWETEGKTKTPYAIHSPGDEILAFAGLYTWWPDKSLPEDHEDYWTLTATILTRAAVGEVSQLHDRTPVTLPPSFWDEWLDADQDGDQTLVDAAVAAATPVAEALQFHRVGPLKGDGPGLVTPAESV
ncbi:SOS response-associated peptidase [Arthrobacter sp. N199823]|uniref:SOS response-associated peptidase n=1 Tax=Arthrobacter sp. N199823 TaxID=2058895 RepID=UPI000CE439A0|nr:SOS response-associated peptidase [Arthrobacter sp. N199823]